MAWPLPFIEQMTARLGSETRDFLAALSDPPTIGVRVNPRKPVTLPWATTPIPWSTHGHYLQERPSFTLFPPFHGGSVYVQEPSSMFLEQALSAAHFDGPVLALDLCGAPGGKTTHLLSILGDDSIVVTNEVIRTRVSILEENVIKWGAPNTMVTSMDPTVMAQKRLSFDLVVVDAPCSGEGLFRKDAAAAEEWSLTNVQHCAARQERIVEAAMALTAPGGTLIYSTCTYEPSENEAHSVLLREAGWQVVPIPKSKDYGIRPIPYQGHLSGYQFYPHQVKGEGFYLSVWQKPGTRLPRHWAAPIKSSGVREWSSWVAEPEKWVAVEKNGTIRLLPKALSGTMMALSTTLRPKFYGLEAFTQKGTLLLPQHALAMTGGVSDRIPALPVTQEEALHYLSREPLTLSTPKGWLLVTYKGLPLGWAKGLGHRLNNYYPQHWRIRNLDKLR